MYYRHRPGLHITSRFSEDALFRYRLVVENQIKNKGLTLCVIMQNPSDANNERADKSVQFLESLVFEKDYEIFKNVRKMIIVNQFAFIQKHGFAGKDDQIGEENDRELTEAIKESDIVLIAWGKNNHFRDRKELVYSILTDLKDKTIFETKKHPSRGYYKDFIKAVEIVDLRT